MPESPAASRPLVLSMLPAGSAERRGAAVVAALSVVIFLVVVPYARVPLARVSAFIPSYESSVIIVDLITAAMLFGQFAITRSCAVQALASTYLYTGLMTVPHALSFPGAFSDTGLMGAGPQTTAWLYMLWHAGFPTGILAYVLLKGCDGIRLPVPAAITLSVIAVLGLVATLAAVTTVGAAYLPILVHGTAYNIYAPGETVAVAIVLLLILAALAVLLRQRPPSVLDLWLMVVLGAWLCDVALSAFLNAGRFDVGFYAGRAYGLAATSCVLVVLLIETIALYARLAQSLQAEAEERERRVGELRSELLHVSRLSELGQMVSVLAHEVKQPLTAIGNYVQAGSRLVRVGDAAKAEAALAKAGDEAVRAAKIIERLQDFSKKSVSAQRVEDMRTIVDETVALALVAADRTRVEVAVDVQRDAAAAYIDKIEIQQVLLNLIRNAIEAMAESPRRCLAIAAAPADNRMIELSVADTGAGLPPPVREKLFQPFVTTKGTGMGIGLSICRSIVEAHGGRLWAEDRLGGGTVFRFTIPQASAPVEQHAAD